MANCLYEYNGQLYTEAQLQDIAIRMHSPGVTLVTNKYSALAGLRLSMLSGIFPGGVDQIMSQYAGELEKLGITRGDLERLQDTPVAVAPEGSPEAVAEADAKKTAAAPKAEKKARTPKRKTTEDKIAGIDTAERPVEKPAPMVPAGTPVVGAITVGGTFDPEKDTTKRKFGEVKRFFQGDIAFAVHVTGPEEIMELVSDGAKRKKRDKGGDIRVAPKTKRILDLEKKYGITSEQANEDARRLARANRSETKEVGIVLTAPKPYVEVVPPVAKPEDPIVAPPKAPKPAKAPNPKKPIVSKIAVPSDGPAPVRMVAGFIPGQTYRLRNKVMVFDHMNIGADGRKYLHFTEPGKRFTNMYVEGEPVLQEIIPVADTRKQVNTNELANKIVAEDSKRIRRQIEVPAGTFPQFPQPIPTDLEGDGPVYEDVQLDIDIDASVMAMLEMLHNDGNMSLVVGGSVRDALEGTSPKDIDIEVYGITLDDLAAKLRPYGSVSLVGKQFGIVTFKPTGSTMSYDFSVPRRETKTGVGTKGFEVEFDPTITIEDAASRRDFTANAMGWDPVNNVLYDYFGGLKDMANGVMRPTSDKFTEDPLRVIRGMQFQTRLGLDFDAQAYGVMQQVVASGEMDSLPTSRIADEFTKWAVKGRHPWKIFDFLRGSGYGARYLPELMELRNTPQDPIWHPEGNVEQHTMQVLARSQEIAEREGLDAEQKQILIYASLLHDIAKPATTREEVRTDRQGNSRVAITAKGHEAAGAVMAPKILRKMGAKQSIIDQIVPLIREHLAHASIAAIPDKAGQKSAFSKLARRLEPANVEQLMMLMEADMMGRNNVGSNPPVTLGLFQQLLEEYKRDNAGKLKFTPILKGRHLKAAGLKPGPLFGQILEAAEKMQLEGGFANESEALEWLSAYMATDDFVSMASRWDGKKIVAQDEPIDLVREDIKSKFPFITDADFVDDALTDDEAAAFREGLTPGPWKNVKEFSDYMATGTFAMVTAENPMAKAMSKAVNEELNRRGMEWLLSQGFEPIPIYGKYGGNPEKSFIVPGMTIQQARQFAVAFMQDSVAHSEGLVYQSGAYNPRVPGLNVEDRFDSGGDFFSTVNVAGQLVDYNLDYDWDTSKQMRFQVDPPLTLAGEEHVSISYGSRKKYNEAIDAVVKSIEPVKTYTSDGRLLEVPRRIVLDTFRESGYVDLNNQVVNSPQDIADLFLIHRSPSIEKGHVIYIKDGKIAGYSTMTMNRPDVTPIGGFLSGDELLKVIERSLDAVGADSFYILHNHPSGNPTASPADKRSAEVFGQHPKFAGSIVIDTDKFTFIDADGFDELMDYKKKPIPLTVPSELTVENANDFVNIAKQLYTSEDADAVLFFNTKLKVVGYEIVPKEYTDAQVEQLIDNIGTAQGANRYVYLTATRIVRKLKTATKLDAAILMHRRGDGEEMAKGLEALRKSGALTPEEFNMLGKTLLQDPLEISSSVGTIFSTAKTYSEFDIETWWDPPQIQALEPPLVRFQRELPETVLRDNDGMPVVGYKAQRGEKDFLKDAVTFTSYEAALDTIKDPGFDSPKAQLAPAYLKMENPIMRDPADQFLDYTALEAALGAQSAADIMAFMSAEVEATDNWWNNFSEEFDSVQDLIKRNPARLSELYVPAAEAFADREVVSMLRAAGFDSAVYADAFNQPQYTVFTPNGIVPAIDQSSYWMARAADPKVQQLLGGLGYNANTISSLQKLSELNPPPGSPMTREQATAVQTVLDRFMVGAPFVDVVLERPPKVDRVFRYPNGEPYGGQVGDMLVIYDDAEVNTRPLREFSHIWMRAMAYNNPSGFVNAVLMVEDTPYMQLANDAIEFSELNETQRMEEAMAMAVGRAGQDLPMNHPLRKFIETELERAMSAMGLDPVTTLAASEMTFQSLHDVMAAEDVLGKDLTEVTQQDIDETEPQTAIRYMLATSDIASAANKRRLTMLQNIASRYTFDNLQSLESVTDTVLTNDELIKAFGIDLRPRVLNNLEADGVSANDLKWTRIEDHVGKKAQIAIADRLRVGQGMKGGPLFMFLKENLNIGAVWASAGENAANALFKNAGDITFITFLDESSIYSNEATVNYYFNSLLKMTPADQQKMLEAFEERVAEKKSNIIKAQAKAVKEKKTYKPGNNELFIEIVEGAGSIQELRDRLLRRETLTDRSMVLEDIIRSGDQVSPGTNLHKIQKQLGIPTKEQIVDELSEKGLAHVPAGYAAVAIKIDKNRPPVNLRTDAAARKALGLKESDIHPNYPIYIFGEPIGILETAVPVATFIEEAAKRLGSGQNRMDSEAKQILTGATGATALVKSYNDRGSSMNEEIVEKTNVPFLKFAVLLSKAFPNIPVKFQESTTRRELIKAREEDIITSQNGSVTGYFDEDGVLHLSMKELTAGSLGYHYARLFLLALKQKAPVTYNRGIELITTTDNPYYEPLLKAFGRKLPAETIAEMALSHAVGDSGEAFFALSNGMTPQFYANYAKDVLNVADVESKKINPKGDATVKTQMQYDLVHQKMMEHRDWLNTMWATLGNTTGITSAHTGELANMGLDEFVEAMFKDMVQATPIAIGEHTTAQMTQADIAVARHGDNFRFQQAVTDGPDVAMDRAIALLHARGLEEAGATPEEIEQQTTWYRGAFNKWSYNYEVEPPLFTADVPGYEMLPKAAQAAAVLNNTYGVDFTSLAALQDQVMPLVEDYNRPALEQDNFQALAAFDQYVEQQTLSDAPVETLPFAMHPALKGVSQNHLETRAMLLRNTMKSSVLNWMRTKYRRLENPAPTDFVQNAKKSIKREIKSRPGDRNRQDSMQNMAASNIRQQVVNHDTEGSYATMLDFYGENSLRSAYTDGLYRDRTLHVAPGRTPTMAAVEQMLDLIGTHKNTTDIVYAAFLQDGLIETPSQDKFNAITSSGPIQKLRSMAKLPQGLYRSLVDALRSLGVAEGVSEKYLKMNGAPARVAEWVERAGDASFAEAYNNRIRFQVDPNDPLVAEFLSDVKQHPEITPDEWLALVADDLNSGRLPREVFDYVMGMIGTVPTAKKVIGNQLTDSALANGLRNMFNMYRERLEYGMGAIALKNAFVLEVKGMMSEKEIREAIGQAAEHQTIDAILEQVMNSEFSTPAVAVQQADAYLVANHMNGGTTGIYGPPAAHVVLAWGLAKKKMEGMKAYLEDLQAEKYDPQRAADIRTLNDSIQTMTLAIFKAGSETGRALRMRQVLYSMSDATPDQYVDQIENELFGPKGQRTGKKKGFTKQERAFVIKEYQEMLEAKAAVQRFDSMAETRTDAVIREEMAKGLEVLRKSGALTTAEFNMLVEALQNHAANHSTAGRQQLGIRQHSDISTSNYYGNLAKVIGQLAKNNPKLKTLDQVFDAVQQLVPGVKKAHVAQVLYHSSPDPAKRVLSALQSQRRATVQMRETMDKLQAEAQELLTSQRQNGPRKGDAAKLASIQKKMEQVMAFMAHQEIDDVTFGKTADDILTTFQRLHRATTVSEDGDLIVDPEEVVAALGGINQIRMMLASTTTAAEMKLDALIAAAKAGDVDTVLKAMEPKPKRVYTVAELAARKRLQDKRAALQMFYDANRTDRSGWQKFTHGFSVTAATVMASKAMIDLSMVGVQGALILYRTFNPLRAVGILMGHGTMKEWGRDIYGFFSTFKRSLTVARDALRKEETKKHLLAQDQQAIQNHHLYAEMIAAGIEFSDVQMPGGIPEDMFGKTWVDIMATRIHMKRTMGQPLTAWDRAQLGFSGFFSKARDGSEAAFVGYLNAWRVRLFEQMYAGLARSMGPGYVPTQKDLEYIGTQVNIWTARAATGNKTLDNLAVAFWAYRMMVSKFRFMVNTWKDPAVAAYTSYKMTKEKKGTPEYLQMESKRRILLSRSADNWIAVSGFGMAYIAGYWLLDALCPEGASIGTNARQGDFLKLRCGQRAWDPTGGFVQYASFFAKMYIKFAESANWQEESTEKSDYFFNKTSVMAYIGQFIKGKLNPMIGELNAVIFNEDFLGRQMHDGSMLERVKYIVTSVFTPMFISGTIEQVANIDEEGNISLDEEWARTPTLSIAAVPGSFLGFTESVYDSGTRKNAAVNEYMAQLGDSVPTLRMPKGLRQKDNPDVYEKAKEEYDSELVNWVRDQLIAGRKPTAAQIKAKANQIKKKIIRKYKSQAKRVSE